MTATTSHTGSPAPARARAAAHAVPVPVLSEHFPAQQWSHDADPIAWQRSLTERVRERIGSIVHARSTEIAPLGAAAADLIGVLDGFAQRGKLLRSQFAYLGWRARAQDCDEVVGVGAALELLQAFALLQDDVMDRSDLRRGERTAHRQFADLHRARGLGGDGHHFGESAAVLLGDLCLIWSEQALRDCGLGAAALARGLPVWDAMRQELAVGQYLDLLNDAGSPGTLTDVLAVARHKSGSYTVQKPLLLGAALAGADAEVSGRLAVYGEAIGEAFQLRDDLLGAFGDPGVTGKPVGDDLRAGKNTTVVALAVQLASTPQRRRLDSLRRRASAAGSAEDELLHYQQLLVDTGAADGVEELIEQRVATARTALAGADLPELVSAALHDLAHRCTDRSH